MTELSAPHSVHPGLSFEVTATICNQGGMAGSARGGLFLSSDTVISEETDRRVGQFDPFLAPGECRRQKATVYAQVPSEGIWYVGARISTPEDADPSNDTRISAPLGIGFQPDFVITSVKGPASVEPGQSLSAQVTVCNLSTQAGGTRVSLFLSEDANIRLPSPAGPPPEDILVGEASVPPLFSGQCTTVPVSGLALPPPPSRPDIRAFHLGAVVDPNNAIPEFFEDNNTHPGYLLGVGSGADFLITSVKGPASVQPGQSFTSEVTVCNQGTRADFSRVSLLLSEDASIRIPSPSAPSEDSLVGDAPVPLLVPGQCSTVFVLGQAQPPATSSPDVRAFHLGAGVYRNSATLELIEDNNTHPGYLLGVGSGADFFITSVKGPASVGPGQALTAQVAVCNQGTQAGGTRVALLLSEDASIRAPSPSAPSGDALVGVVQVPSLFPGRCATVSLSGSISPPPVSGPDTRAFHLGAMVDPDNTTQELIEGNNTHSGYLLGVGTGADFVITSVKGPASVQPGQPLTAQVTVCNQGTVAESTRVALLLSEDASIRPPSPSAPPEDSLVSQAPVSQLAPGQCATVSLSGSAQVPPMSRPDVRAFHLGAVVDPDNATPEFIEDNNTHSGYLLGVGAGADFVIGSVKGPASVYPGQPLTAEVAVCNQGTRAESTRVTLLLSKDESIRVPSSSGSSEDVIVGDQPVPSVLPGQCVTVTISGQASGEPPRWPGDFGFYLGAVVDPNNATPELIEDNNIHSGDRLGVGPEADFVISEMESPVFARSGQSLGVQLTVCNQGTRAGSTRVRVLLSTDATLDLPSPQGPSEDVLVGEVSTQVLQPGWCQTLSVTGNAHPPQANPDTPGLYYVGAVVNPVGGPELFTDNNTLLGGWIYIAP
ncbi:putative fibronectin type III domain protein [Cystobacter fuscus DSM 2262]|uniref:Fibronectin type III domain protein n=1 Tax=Cystobacter fuscus (strain ATCC 25194 / DSM 2262 / NBRC 100088 / M29) TaxID=1242864 RepID=S9QLF0_CYSF2|nr:putative fibronectin type III domain protein [Cystobacter fuscus DSM 2262]